jgi:hypothetical protein
LSRTTRRPISERESNPEIGHGEKRNEAATRTVAFDQPQFQSKTIGKKLVVDHGLFHVRASRQDQFMIRVRAFPLLGKLEDLQAAKQMIESHPLSRHVWTDSEQGFASDCALRFTDK